MYNFINASHYYYIVLAFFLSGLAILFLDVKRYNILGEEKEKKRVLFLVWFNIIIAILMFLTGLAYR